MITASTPCPRVKAAAARTGSAPADRSISLGAEALSKREPFAVEVEAQHAAAVRPQQLHRDQADQPEPTDHNRLAESRRDEPDALQSDGAEHGEGGGIVGHGVGHLGAEVRRHAHHLGMLAVGCDTVADRETGDAGADLDHPARIAVAERQRLIELVAHGLDGRQQAVRPHLVEHHAHLVRLLPRLVDQAALAEIHEHALGARRNEGSRGANEDVPSAEPRGWRFGDLGRASAQVLQNLLHAALSPFSGGAIGMLKRAIMASVASLTGFSGDCKQ